MPPHDLFYLKFIISLIYFISDFLNPTYVIARMILINTKLEIKILIKFPVLMSIVSTDLPYGRSSTTSAKAEIFAAITMKKSTIKRKTTPITVTTTDFLTLNAIGMQILSRATCKTILTIRTKIAFPILSPVIPNPCGFDINIV